MIHCGSCKYEWKPKKRKQTHNSWMRFGFIYIGCVLLWSLTSGRPAEYSFELRLHPPIKTLFEKLFKNNLLWCLLFLHPIADVISTSLTSTSIALRTCISWHIWTKIWFLSCPFNIQKVFTLLRILKCIYVCGGCHTHPVPKWSRQCRPERYSIIVQLRGSSRVKCWAVSISNWRSHYAYSAKRGPAKLFFSFLIISKCHIFS